MSDSVFSLDQNLPVTRQKQNNHKRNHPAMEAPKQTQTKDTNAKRASASDGKRKLSDAIQSESVEGVRDALLFLSTTSLAWQVKDETDDVSECIQGNNHSNDKPRRKHMRINVDFSVRVPNHHCSPDGDPSSSMDTASPTEWTNKALHAAIGPNKIHTELVRCLLTAQRITNSETNSEIILTTNAKEKLLQVSHDFWHESDRRPGTTPLGMACRYRNLDLIQLLLEHGADPNTNTTRRPGSTPLALACQQGDGVVSRLLLEYGADPNACGNDGLTPLIRASRTANLDMVQLLLMPREETNNNKNSNTMEIIRTSNRKQTSYCPHSLSRNGLVMNQLSFHQNRWGTNIYHYDQQSMNALMHACAENHEAIVRFLVLGGGDNLDSIVQYVNHYRVDPALWYASAHGSTSIVKFLMDECFATASYRKDPTVYSSTPLEEASQWGHVSTVQALLERSGSDPRTRQGKKARTQAERSGHLKVVELLDVWMERMKSIERTRFPMGLLPRLLTRKAELAHRILCNHADGLGVYPQNRTTMD